MVLARLNGSDELLTGRHGQFIASLTSDTKCDYGKEARHLISAIDVCINNNNNSNFIVFSMTHSWPE